MTWTLDSTLFALFLSVQFIGLLGLIASRMATHVNRPAYGQIFFFGSLLVVAAATVISLWMRDETWAVSGTTLSCMVVGATFCPNHSGANSGSSAI